MGDRYFDLGNFSVNNELDDAGEESRCCRPTSASSPARAGWRTLSLFRFMSDFREAMWGVVQSGVSDIDFDFNEYASKHFDRMARDRRRPQVPDLARGGDGGAVRSSCPDSARCVIIGGGVGGTSIAYHLGEAGLGPTWSCSSAPSSPRARPSTRPGWSASFAARSR